MFAYARVELIVPPKLIITWR